MHEFNPKRKWLRALMAPTKVSKAAMRWLSETSLQFERRLQKASRGAKKVGDAATKVDSSFGRWIKKLFSPIVRLYDRLSSPIRRFVRDSPLIQKIAKATYWLWYPFIAIASFGRSFIQSRSRDLLVWSIPFLVVVGGSLFGLWILSLEGRSVSQKYRLAVDEALAKGEFQQAALYQQKLQTLGIISDPAEMIRIRELVKGDKLGEAIDMAERLTPNDRPGSPDIHFWLANIYFEEKGPVKGEAAINKAIYHVERLEQALQALDITGNAFPPNVVMLKALIEFRKNNVAEGLGLLKSVSKRYWPALVLQMETHIRLKQDEDAMQDAIALSEVIDKDSKVLDEVSPLFFPMWVTALTKAGEREAMKNAVMIWHDRFPDHPLGLARWAGVQLEEIDALMARGSDADVERASKVLVEVSNKVGGQGQEAMSSWLMQRLPPTGSNRNYVRLAEKAGQESNLPSMLLEVLGTTATVRGEHKLALDLLKQATEKDPQNAIAWNNLAFVASKHFEGEMELALKAANQAAQMQPKNIEIMHTRGMVYLKLRRWQLAIEDLRAVLAERPNAPDIHLDLAKAYAAIGKNDLAALHQQLANGQ